VEGTPEVRQYTKNDGTQGASLSLRISTVQLLGQKVEGNGQEASTGGGYSQGYQQPQQQNSYKETAPATQAMPEPVDDLPF
jgi:single-strand DNA-binding protein